MLGNIVITGYYSVIEINIGRWNMEVEINTELEKFIRQKILTGDYVDTDEVIGEAVLYLKERDMLREVNKAELDEVKQKRYTIYETELNRVRQLIEEGINSGDAGEWNFEEFKREVRVRWEQKKLAAENNES
jgi:putative addiction module CopG family antidote